MWYESVQHLTCVGVGLAVAVLFLLQKVISQSAKISSLEEEVTLQIQVKHRVEEDLGHERGQRQILERWLKDETERDSGCEDEVYFLRRCLNPEELEAHVKWEKEREND